MSKIGYYISLEIYEPINKERKNKRYEKIYEREHKAHSFVASFTGFLYSLYSGMWSFIDKNGNSVDILVKDIEEMTIWGVDNDDNTGILIGRNNEAVSRSDNWLYDQIRNTDMKHYNMSQSQIGQNYFEIKRKFENISGSSQSIGEIGLSCKVVAGGSTYYVLFCRDAIYPVEVPSEGLLIVTYRIEVD